MRFNANTRFQVQHIIGSLVGLTEHLHLCLCRNLDFCSVSRLLLSEVPLFSFMVLFLLSSIFDCRFKYDLLVAWCASVKCPRTTYYHAYMGTKCLGGKELGKEARYHCSVLFLCLFQCARQGDTSVYTDQCSDLMVLPPQVQPPPPPPPPPQI